MTDMNPPCADCNKPMIECRCRFCDVCGEPWSTHLREDDGTAEWCSPTPLPLPDAGAGAPGDELGTQRQMKESAEAFFKATGDLQGPLSTHDEEFNAWILKNMPEDGIAPYANSLVGSILGSIIGVWFDCGAKPKEYLARFVDMVWEKYEALRRFKPPDQPDPTAGSSA